MPTYEYHCDACEHDFEKFQSMSAEPIKVCPNCGKKKVRRLIGTGAGLIFKGSGFYITDYRDKGYADKAKAESGTGSGGGETKSSDGGSNGGDTAKPAAESKSTETKTAAPAKAESAAKPVAESKPAKKDKK